MSSTEVQYIRALNGKLIPRESRDPTASASAWAVKWKLPSEGSRIPLVNEEGGCSPGPKSWINLTAKRQKSEATKACLLYTSPSPRDS